MLERPAVTIVWFKRDFRLEDHPPLARAAANGKVLPLWVIEPDWWRSPEMDRSHFLFAMQSALELRGRLQAMGGDLMIRVGETKTILEELSSKFLLKELVSHEETGSWWTYQRDRQVAKWCQEHRVPWVEFRQDGVVRRLASRDRWASHWNRWVTEPLIQPPTRIELPEGFQRGDDPMAFAKEVSGQPADDLQPGGASPTAPRYVPFQSWYPIPNPDLQPHHRPARLLAAEPLFRLGLHHGASGVSATGTVAMESAVAIAPGQSFVGEIAQQLPIASGVALSLHAEAGG